ncbi:MAG: RNA polymerase sigma factor [Acidobacteria bacterium]|nr:RNA polymerase sigma factor [Acidobacteriota bacterium]
MRIPHVSRPADATETMSSATTPSDQDLLRLMMAGDEDAFTALYRRHQGSIYRFALLMSGSASVADDVTQEVFLALMNGGQRYDSTRGPLHAFLHGIARNQVLRGRRRDRGFSSLEEEAEDGETSPVRNLASPDDPLADIVRGEMIDALRQAVLALPARYREIVVLCDFQELSYAEAALALDCAVGTVSSRLNRARTLLAERLRAMNQADAAIFNAAPLKCLV